MLTSPCVNAHDFSHSPRPPPPPALGVWPHVFLQLHQRRALVRQPLAARPSGATGLGIRRVSGGMSRVWGGG